MTLQISCSLCCVAFLKFLILERLHTTKRMRKVQIWRRNKLIVQAVALPSMLLIKIHVMSIKLGDMKFLSQLSSEKLSQYSIKLCMATKSLF